MQKEINTPALAERLKELSPAKRALLLKALREKAVPAAEPAIAPRGEQRSFPLSFNQQRLWFLEQLEPGRAVYNIPLAIRLQGQLKTPALAQSLDEIMRRHEVLRTTFTALDGQLIQVIAPTMALPLPVVDLRHLPETAREAAVQQRAAEVSREPFDLARGPLWRATLLQLHATEHLLLLVMHHIVSDNWSIGIFIQEMAALYNAFSQNQPSLLPELPIQYADFALWQRQKLQGKELADQLAYWKQQLAGAPPLLELPTDRPRPATQSFRGASQAFALSPAFSEALSALSQREGVTLFMTLLTAFKILLYRYSAQEDILVGTPVANRHRPEIEKLLGFFVNTLVLRTQVDGEMAFRELLSRVRENCLDAFSHQEMPFEKLVEELQPDRDMSRNPFFQVMFVLLNAPQASLALSGLRLTPLSVHNGTAMFDLTMTLWEEANGLSGKLEYNTDLFEAATIQSLLQHFQNLLEGIVSKPSQPISALALLTPVGRRQMLVEWNATQREYPQEKCFHHLFEEQVERTPEAIAITFEEQQLTYRELNRRANQLAHHLQELGVGPEVMVGICLERSIEMVIGLLGILKAGGAYVPLDPAYPVDRIAYVLEDAQVPVLLTKRSASLTLDAVENLVMPQSRIESTLTGRSKRPISQPVSEALLNLNFSAGNFKIVSLDYESGCGGGVNDLNPSYYIAPENLAYTIYTSGSTGKPKGVAISHGALVNFLFSMQETPGFTAQDVVLSVTTLSFDIAGLEIYLPLLVGGRIVLASRETAADGKLLIATLTDSGATVMQATPATWRMLIENGWPGSRNLKILCGGEAMPRELANQLLERGAELWNMYGPTETTIWSTLDKIEPRDGALTIGRPIANTQIYLLDRHWQVVPLGVHGALHIGGDGLARGYFQRPELTAEKFIPDAHAQKPGARIYHTGDLARYLPDGRIDCLGRADHQVKIRGFRIELGEIEAVCAQHPQIEQAVVTSTPLSATPLTSTSLSATPPLSTVTPSGVEERRLVAYVVSRDKQPLPVSELRQFLMKKLPDYMIPSAFVFLDALPLTPNGKVDRRALPPPDLTRRELPDTFVAPGSPVEKILAGIWHQVLGVAKIGVHDNFFELGGHSLLATQVNSRLRKIFGVDFPLRALFEAPTVATFAQRLAAEFGNNGKLAKIAQMMEKLNTMSAEDKKRFLEQKRREELPA